MQFIFELHLYFSSSEEKHSQKKTHLQVSL